jgi:hypothetical protein
MTRRPASKASRPISQSDDLLQFLAPASPLPKTWLETAEETDGEARLDFF